MINIIGSSIITIPVTLIEWAPRNWSDREAWGPEATDGFYLTRSGDVYRLSCNLVVFVTEQPELH